MNALLLALLIQASPPQGGEPIVVPTDQIVWVDELGTCEGHGHAMDMHRVMFLENRSIDIDSADGPLRIWIDGEDLHRQEIGERSQHRQYINNIGYEVDERGDLDVMLKLAYFQGRLAVYWRETFQNRIYRQGLYEIAGPRLTLVCTGEGGRHVER